MGLNRIIDRNIDAENPRTAKRHLASGSMSLKTAWILCGIFLGMLVLGAAMLNPLCLYLSHSGYRIHVVYPYLKRFTWLLPLVAWRLPCISSRESMGSNNGRNILQLMVSGPAVCFIGSPSVDCCFRFGLCTNGY